ncbi:hypothetical protein ACVU7I_06970 [Patulibacter sp. S7RM1-6]
MGTSDLPQSTDPDRSLAARRAEEQRPLDEAGEGQSEGFELAEQELIEHASHGDQHGTTPIVDDARATEAEPDPAEGAFGEPDEELHQDLGPEDEHDAPDRP